LALITYGTLAMTADQEKEAAEMYERAETLSAEAGFPFELARIRSGTPGPPRQHVTC
jgi:hypothetical protein